MATMRLELEEGAIEVECPCGEVTPLPALWCQGCAEELDADQAELVPMGTA